MARKVISPPPELKDAKTTPVNFNPISSNHATIWKLPKANNTTIPTLILYGIKCMKYGAIDFNTNVGTISANSTIPLLCGIRSSKYFKIQL